MRGSRRNPKPTWLRWLARDVPQLYGLAIRAREKSQLVAADLRPRAKSTPPAKALDPGDLVAELSALGVQAGDALLVHSSWDTARALAPSPANLITAIRQLLGDEGTLCMPTFPRMSAADPSALFDVRRSPSGAGLVTEVFRRTPGVTRSLQMRSVSAIGPLASDLLSEHHLSPYPSGELSPHVKLAAKGGKILCLGVGPNTNTLFHCPEDLLKEDFPAPVYENGQLTIRVKRQDGTAISVATFERTARWHNCADPARLLPYFDGLINERTIAGVDVSLVPASVFLDRLLFLAARGIHMYGFRFPPPARVLPHQIADSPN